MKVIDLLNKIANGEINEFYINNYTIEGQTIDQYFDSYAIVEGNLNAEIDEIEIIEEIPKVKSGITKDIKDIPKMIIDTKKYANPKRFIEEPKKIEKLDNTIYNVMTKDKNNYETLKIEALLDTVNLIIDIINKGE